MGITTYEFFQLTIARACKHVHLWTTKWVKQVYDVKENLTTQGVVPMILVRP